MGDSPKLFLETIEKKLALAESQSYSCLICFLIGNVAPLVNDKLSYILKRDADSNTTLVSMEEIHSMIYTKLSKLPNTVPAIIFNTCISQDIPRSTVDSHFCPNTFLCYASNNVTTLPQGVEPHQLVQSLYEVLNDSKDRSLLLMELFNDVRDNYFSRFPENVKNTFNKETTFYSKNTIRTPTQINDVEEQSRIESNSDLLQTHPGLFFLIYSSALLEDVNETTPELMDGIESVFETMKYKIGQDILLTEKQNLFDRLGNNFNLLSKDCRSIFILVLTKVYLGHQVHFDDGTSIDVNMFTAELTKNFPELPHIIFFSQILEPQISDPIFSIQSIEHMLVVYSIESNLSDSSLINNFAIEVFG